MSPISAAAEPALREGGPASLAAQMPAYDVRLRREITHRRLGISLLRRFARVVSLHGVDALLVGGSLLALAEFHALSAEVRPLVPAVVLIFLLGLNALSAYRPGDGRRDLGRLTSGVVVATLILACLVAFPPHLAISSVFLAQLGVLALVALAGGRKAVDLAVRQAYVRGYGLRRAVLIGGLDEVGTALRELRDGRNIDHFVLGHLAPAASDDPTSIGSVADLPRVLDEMAVEEVLIATSLDSGEMRLVTTCCFERGVVLFVLPDVTGRLDCWSELLPVGGCTMLRLHPARLEMPSLLIKRGVDILGALLVIVLFAPLLALVALLIKVDSPGPVFFRQERMGLGGRTFTIWKFRSMTADAEAREPELAHLSIYGGGGAFKVPRDPRVTRVGRVLRRTSLDELPQVFNVLCGEMSLVGPRPASITDVRRYQPHHFQRFSVMPGITGPWQVNGRNLITDFETVVKMEHDYIARWSLLIDLKIMLRTLVVVARGDGAY